MLGNKDFNLLQHSEKLGEIVELIINQLKAQKVLPHNMPSNQLDQLREQVVTLLQQSPLKFMASSLKPKEEEAEIEAQLTLMNLLTFTVTSEYLRLVINPLFSKRNENDKTLQAALDELNKKIDELDKAKTPEEAKRLYDEIMELCNELKARKDVTFYMKMQLEIIMQITAPQSRDKAVFMHDPKFQQNREEQPEGENDFTLYLRALFGGTLRAGGTTTVVAAAVSNEQSIGAVNASGDPNDLSQVAEANRYDAKGDSSGRENVILENLISKGTDIVKIVGADYAATVLEAVQTEISLIPPPSLGPL